MDGMREWLRAIDMLAAFQSLHGNHGVGVVGSRHNDRVDVLLFLVEHLPIVAINACLWVFTKHRSGEALVDITEHVDPFSRAALQIAASHAAHTDTGNANRVARRLKACSA